MKLLWVREEGKEVEDSVSYMMSKAEVINKPKSWSDKRI